MCIDTVTSQSSKNNELKDNIARKIILLDTLFAILCRTAKYKYLEVLFSLQYK